MNHTNTRRNRRFIAITTLAAAGTIAMAADRPSQATPGPAATPPPSEALVARGKYLVTIGACNDCHTPMKMGDKGPEPDMDRMLSGHPASMVLPPAPTLPEGPWLVVSSASNTAWSGPWGTSYTANLTPHDVTGLGQWTLRNFRDTLRTGKHMGRGRAILPPMPWPMYQHFTDEDIEAIYSYLRTVPAIDNKVPDPLPPAAG